MSARAARASVLIDNRTRAPTAISVDTAAAPSVKGAVQGSSATNSGPAHAMTAATSTPLAPSQRRGIALAVAPRASRRFSRRPWTSLWLIKPPR